MGRDLSPRVGLQLVPPGERALNPVRSVRDLTRRSAGDLTRISSERVRTQHEREALDAMCDSSLVIELQGELGFAAVDAISRAVEPKASTLAVVIVDVELVGRVEADSGTLLAGLASSFARAGIDLVVSGHSTAEVREAVGRLLRFPTLAEALEWVEDELLLRRDLDLPPRRLEADEHEFLAGLDDLDRTRLARLLHARTYARHAILVDRGAPADELFLVLKGQLSISADVGTGSVGRATTVPAGGSFGEVGLALGGTNAATVQAETEVDVLVLDRDALDEIREHNPRLYATVLEHLFVAVARTAARLHREVVGLTEP